MINKVYYNNDIIEIHDITNKYILTDTGDKIPLKDTDKSRILNYVDYNNYIKENEPKIQAIEKKLEKYEEKLVDLNDKMLTLQDKIITKIFFK